MKRPFCSFSGHQALVTRTPHCSNDRHASATACLAAAPLSSSASGRSATLVHEGYLSRGTGSEAGRKRIRFVTHELIRCSTAGAACIGMTTLPSSQVDDETLFNLILAANYLDIKPLLDLTCKTVADEIKGKTPEEIRIRFNIKNDFTPEEEEEVKRENAWCEER